jgi:hypothetical protein
LLIIEDQRITLTPMTNAVPTEDTTSDVQRGICIAIVAGPTGGGGTGRWNTVVRRWTRDEVPQ